MKKKFKNFLKQLGDSPKKKRNISANVRIMRSLWNEVEQIWENGEPSHFPHNPC